MKVEDECVHVTDCVTNHMMQNCKLAKQHRPEDVAGTQDKEIEIKRAV